MHIVLPVRIILLLATLLSSIQLSAHNVVRYAYDVSGRLVLADLAPGQYIRYSYDLDSNLIARTIINLVDTDNDKMDDVWEKAYFGDLSHDGTADSDHDGENDYREFIALTNPDDNKSTFRVVATTLDSNNATFLIEWDAVPGASYIIETATGLDTTWTTENTISADQSAMQYIISLASISGDAHFYRVRIATD